MSMSIGGISGYASTMMYPPMNGNHRNDPSKTVDKLFSELDTTGKGYLEKSDLASAFQQIDSTAGTGSNTSVDDVFSALDTDADGKLTKEEMTSSLQKLGQELDNQFNAMRMSGMGGPGGAQGMPPPPPPPADEEDAGLTQDEMTEIAATTTDTKLADLLNSVASNFEAADANGDGRVTRQEAMDYQTSQAGTSASTGASTLSNAAVTSSSDSEAQVLRRIMDLVRAYGLDGSENRTLGTLSETV